jgi:hypothetical protein
MLHGVDALLYFISLRKIFLTPPLLLWHLINCKYNGFLYIRKMSLATTRAQREQMNRILL